MIQMVFEDGTVWTLAPEDTFTDVDGVERTVGDIQTIKMIGVAWGIARGRAPAAGGVGQVEIRGLRLHDDPDRQAPRMIGSDLHVDIPWSVDTAKEIAAELVAKQISVARAMPPSV